MKLEFKKSISNKVFIILGSMFVFLFLLGYFLLVGIDKVSHVTPEMFFFSSYTVATQFGLMLFSFVIAFFINREYSNKNILFYKLIGENIYTFFYKKIAVLFLECFVFIALGLLIISLMYHNFSHFGLLLFLFSAVILQYILIIGTISMLCSNILTSIGVSIVYWITSVILVAISNKTFGFIAPFEAGNTMYHRIERVLQSDHMTLGNHDILYIILYLVSIMMINAIILRFSKTRWIKMGI
ncbi:peptide ABC transporter permease [Bacillus spizizenii]|uniref:Peptide ABC transporter permease n=1 Tax=Bacillus spizizenii TaxID=96241 RepID=A0A9Q4DM98_BACSC|nr:peptide ABC transporter permease [Bacillus spizizenii]MDU7575186.1 peptide ABC transporter permease [Bacillus subtilis]MCY7810512.1 peptide ABC transporter permease [Bacillus spizizenii]MCY7828900.1 peptide ABC transporter permease [Bacillus spizizenii]MCY7841618.1 peptide ABC transporter permease [Bacillus spizizenii]MCY7852952.1 peptide ABC transporter permease [Bacillus spizizenii]